MTVRPLLDELQRKDTEEVADLRQRAAEEAESIRLAARAAAEQRAAAARTVHDLAASRELAAASSEATRRMNARLLPARSAALDRIFARAKERLELRVTHPDLAEAIRSQVNDALTYLPDGPVRVTCAPRAAKAVREALAQSTREAVVVEDATVPLGVVVDSGDGEITVAATFARRMARERAVLATDVARRLMEPRP